MRNMFAYAGYEQGYYDSMTLLTMGSMAGMQYSAEYAYMHTPAPVSSVPAQQSALNTSSQPQTTALQTYYPPNDGFLGDSQYTILNKGTLIQRTGHFYGPYAARFGTPQPMLALPHDKIGQPTTVFTVVKPIHAMVGQVAPWFGQPGLGTQYYLPVTIETLRAKGFLEILL